MLLVKASLEVFVEFNFSAEIGSDFLHGCFANRELIGVAILLLSNFGVRVIKRKSASENLQRK